MPSALAKLLGLLDLEQIEDNIFRGESVDIGSGSVFGGQVLGQALRAAGRTVEAERKAHSLHAYFILPGDVKAPIVYEVDRIRDGRSFTTRRVVAVQHGRPIFNMAASFQIEEDGADHQAEMPDVPGPEALQSEQALRRRIAEKLAEEPDARVPEQLRMAAARAWAIEFRPVEPTDPLRPEKRPPRRHVWLRAAGPLPDDDAVHQSMLALASDYGLMGTALLPHGLSFMQPGFQAASLDHAMWFHRPFRLDDWLLYAMDSPSASNARGLNRGQLFTRDGRLVASVAQEGLMRERRSS